MIEIQLLNQFGTFEINETKARLWIDLLSDIDWRRSLSLIKKSELGNIKLQTSTVDIQNVTHIYMSAIKWIIFSD